MINVMQPFHLLVIALAGWLNRQQQTVISYIIEENRVLKEQQGDRQMRFTNQQRRRLDVKAKAMGRKLLNEVATGHRATKYSREFRSQLKRYGVTSIRCPPQTPNCNAFTERFVRSVREECLDRLILFGEHSLRRAIREYMLNYHCEHNHQGVNNKLLEPLASVSMLQPIKSHERLGGMLKYY